MTILVNRADYFDCALRLLAAEGPSALKVGRLCGDLGVTTGSFYHHFQSMRSFVGELLAHWEVDKTEQYAELLDEVDDPLAGLPLIREAVHALPHRAEAALRAWSHTDTQVAAAQARVDARRLEAVQRLVQRLVGDTERAARLALLGVVILAGFQVGRDPDDHDELSVLMDEYLGLLAAPAASASAPAPRSPMDEALSAD